MILVLHPGALGDLILALPALAALRSHFTGAHITIAGNQDYLRVIARGYADELLSLSVLPLHRLFSPDPLPPDDIRFWRSYHKVVSWTGAGDAVFERQLISANSAALIRSWRPEPGETRSVSQIFMDGLGSCLSPVEPDLRIRISLDESAFRSGDAWLRENAWTPELRLTAIHPGAGSLIKRWPADRYRDLTRALAQEEGSRIVIVEGPAEEGVASEVAQGIPSSAILIARSLPLGRLAGVLARCQIFIGNDSGVSHLAAGLGVPSLLLFGPTSPRHWAPKGDRVEVIRRAQRCRGCARRKEEKHTCLENISLHHVMSGIEHLRSFVS